ncbi:hypothetical protein L6164_021307 [Bauhinia variegata]|uniref:Uncharacterized protein n=1 Tax=Bauhinia variegata TaxID=167791 RepID=A0ACB9N3F6_BAUVA|nr:hypothetical protein L6164_021307 [Bauhinia variegata]
MGSLEEILKKMPVGFRFQPTDEELVNYFLKHKLLGENLRVRFIREIDICKFEPWDLPELSVVKSDDQWFFFSPRDLKYSNSNRRNRATKAGFWKATGKDRNVKKRGTNNVIGTKKTLVFYEGRVPQGIKSNWVIHEYHATTFPADLRTYVLCRLMKKPGKKTEEGTDGLIYIEGEPSSHMASDYENQATVFQIPDVNSLEEANLESVFTLPPQAEEYDFVSLQQEQAFSISSFPNALFGIANDANQFLPETTEEEDNDAFLNAIIAGEDIVCTEETRRTFVTESTPSGSLRKVYYESSDTEAEVISARSSTVLDGPTACSQHAGSREYWVMKMFTSSHGALHAGSLLASNREVNREKKDSIHNDFWEVDTFSGDSPKDQCLPINCVSIDSSPSPPRRYKVQYHPKSDNSVSQKASASRRSQKKVSSKEISKNEALKETYIVQSNKDQGKILGTSSGKNPQKTSIGSSEVDRKGSFIYWETPSSQKLYPRSAYLVNVVLGFSLLIVSFWDLVSSRN